MGRVLVSFREQRLNVCFLAGCVGDNIATLEFAAAANGRKIRIAAVGVVSADWPLRVEPSYFPARILREPHLPSRLLKPLKADDYSARLVQRFVVKPILSGAVIHM